MARPRKQKWERQGDEWIAEVRVYVPTSGRRVKRVLRVPTTKTEKQRDLELAKMIAEIEDTEGVKPPPPTTVIDYGEQWLAQRAPSLRPKTAQTYVRQLGRYVLPAPSFVGVLAAAVTRKHVMDWADWVVKLRRADNDEPISHEYIQGCWRTAKQMLKDMAADHGIADPTLRVRAPHGQHKHVRETGTLTVADAHRVVAWALEKPDERRAAEVLFHVMTGTRSGEVYALRVHDLDWDRGTATVARASSFVTDEVHEGGTKTGIIRDVSLAADLQAMLKSHLANLADHPSRTEVHDAGPLVFPAPTLNKHGTWHRRGNTIYKVLARAESDLKLAVRLRPQVLRRTSARLWAQIDPKLAKSTHGWVTDEMLDHYGEPAADEKAEAVRRIWSADVAPHTPAE